jgi:hemolysin activation/secretion protein
VRPSGKPILPPCQPPRTVAATMPSVAALVLMLLLFSGVSTALAREAAPVQNSVTNQAPTAVAGPRFKVDRYVVEGNTLLSTNLIAKILAPYTGSAVGLDGIKKAGGALQLAYRERGYPTVAVGLPQQKISNGIVRFKVTEGELTSISVVHNRFFSSNNVMRSLPSLGFTNSSRILNGKIFQAELDRANANKDRQIYPEVRPGPEPGTSELVLDVKDRLPLHGKLEFDNYSPPNTPNDRVNLNLSYENLWQLEHTIGFQYGASPERLKETLDVPNMVLAPVDWPAVAYYSAFYRAPLGPPEAIGTEIARDPSQFGYNEATHQFVLPPSSGRPGVTLYANRTTTGTALDVGPYQLVTQSSLETIDQQAFSESLTSQTTAGVRLTLPLPNFWGISSSFSFGTDYKYYESATLATNFFSFTTVITNSEGHRVITHSTNSIVGNTSPSVDYMPISFSWTGSRPDRFGEYDGSFGVEAGTSGWFHPDQKYPQAIVYSRKADMDFVALRPQISRSQHLPDNWTFYANLAAQWANEPLINLEESPLGGVSTVPGYKEGERYGDSGWLLQVELRSPTVWFGKLGAGKLFGAEMTGFSDYGQSHQLDPPPGEKTIEALWGSGVGLNFFLGANVESHLLVAWALRDGDYTKSGSERVSFSVSGQF